MNTIVGQCVVIAAAKPLNSGALETLGELPETSARVHDDFGAFFAAPVPTKDPDALLRSKGTESAEPDNTGRGKPAEEKTNVSPESTFFPPKSITAHHDREPERSAFDRPGPAPRAEQAPTNQLVDSTARLTQDTVRSTASVQQLHLDGQLRNHPVNDQWMENRLSSDATSDVVNIAPKTILTEVQDIQGNTHPDGQRPMVENRNLFVSGTDISLKITTPGRSTPENIHNLKHRESADRMSLPGQDLKSRSADSATAPERTVNAVKQVSEPFQQVFQVKSVEHVAMQVFPRAASETSFTLSMQQATSGFSAERAALVPSAQQATPAVPTQQAAPAGSAQQAAPAAPTQQAAPAASAQQAAAVRHTQQNVVTPQQSAELLRFGRSGAAVASSTHSKSNPSTIESSVQNVTNHADSSTQSFQGALVGPRAPTKQIEPPEFTVSKPANTANSDPLVSLLSPSDSSEMMSWESPRAQQAHPVTPMLARAEIMPHIARQLVEVMGQAAHRPTEIVLSPEELGRVRMSMLAEDGKITVSILTERPETLDLMRRHIDQLGQSFRSMGYDQISFSFGQGAQSGDQSSKNPSANNPSELSQTGTANSGTVIGVNIIDLDSAHTTGIDIRL